MEKVLRSLTEIKMTEMLRRNSYPWQLNLSTWVAFFMMKKNL